MAIGMESLLMGVELGGRRCADCCCLLRYWREILLRKNEPNVCAWKNGECVCWILSECSTFLLFLRVSDTNEAEAKTISQLAVVCCDHQTDFVLSVVVPILWVSEQKLQFSFARLPLGSPVASSVDFVN